MIKTALFTNLLILIGTICYSQDKISEWVNGERSRFKTDGTGKSLGLKLSVDYPKSWAGQDGKRPHIVQKFTGEFSQSKNVVFLIQVVPLENEERRIEILSAVDNPYDFKGSLPSEATFINGGKCKVDALNGAFYVYKMSRSNDLLTVFTKSKSYNFVYKDKWITLLFMASGGTEEETDTFFAKVNPLFSLIANSFVLYNQWGQ